MAQNANAAYMLWRQFSGEARPGASMGLKAPKASTQSADVRVGETAGSALQKFADSMSGFFGYTEKKDKDESDSKVKAWMSQHTMAEYQQKMREGNVPFQNDKVAMDVLHNQAAYNVALQVEEAIHGQIKEGKYKDIAEADKARVEALNAARGEYILSMGISADSKAFTTGFDRDADKRRNLMVSLQTDVTDKNLRTQAKIQLQADLLAPLTPDFVRASPGAVTAAYIGNTIKRAETLGQLRGDADKLEVYNTAMQALQGMPGGAAAIDEMGKQEVDLFGTKASLRTHLGGGVFDQAVLKSRQAEQQQDSQRQGQLNATLMTFQNANDMNGLLGLRKNLEAESGGKMTGEIQAVDQTIEYVNRKIQADNARMANDLLRQQEEDAMMFQGIQGLNKLISGDGLVSPDAKDLGFKDEAMARRGEEQLLNHIADEGERLRTAMKLAADRKEGFAANALKGWGARADAGWNQYKAAVARGDQTAALPESVTRMANLYDANPEAFSMMFRATDYDPTTPEKDKRAQYIGALEAGRAIGVSMEDVARAQIEWDKLPKDTKKQAEDMLTKQLGKVTSKDPSYVEHSLRTLAAPMMTMGMSPEVAVQMARENFNNQHEQVNGFPIHKGFFQVTGDRDSYSAGLQSFNEMVPKLKESIGNPKDSDLAYWYDGNNQTVIALNVKTGSKSAPVTQKDLKAFTAERFAKQQEASRKEVEKVIRTEEHSRKVKKARKDAGVFPYNRPEKNIYGKAIKDAKDGLEGAAEAIQFGTPEQRVSARKVRDGSN